MSGKKKNQNVSAAPDPAALQGPTYAPIPQPQPQPGHLELLSQQLNQGYPSMSSADTLKHLQGVYKPMPAVDPATAAGIAAAKAAPGTRTASSTSGNRGGMQPGMFESFSDFANFINSYRK